MILVRFLPVINSNRAASPIRETCWNQIPFTFLRQDASLQFDVLRKRDVKSLYY